MMKKTRRKFLAEASLGVAAGVVGVSAPAIAAEYAQDPGQQQPAGAPPAFGTGPAVGPEVSATTFQEADKLVQVQMTEQERSQAATSWRGNMAALYERRTGPRKIALETTLAPFSRYQSFMPGHKLAPAKNQFIRSKSGPGPLPSHEEDIAFAPVTQLSRWIEQKKLTSERLTQIYLKRIEQFNPKLRCVITLTRDLALRQAREADSEIAAGEIHRWSWGTRHLQFNKNLTAAVHLFANKSQLHLDLSGLFGDIP